MPGLPQLLSRLDLDPKTRQPRKKTNSIKNKTKTGKKSTKKTMKKQSNSFIQPSSEGNLMNQDNFFLLPRSTSADRYQSAILTVFRGLGNHDVEMDRLLPFQNLVSRSFTALPPITKKTAEGEIPSMPQCQDEPDDLSELLASKRLDLADLPVNTDDNFSKMENWDFLRGELVAAKVIDAFNGFKFHVNGTCLRVLRVLGEGGSAQVFEVYNDSEELLALKVVDLSEVRARDQLVKEIYFLKKLNNCSRVIKMLEFEHKTDPLTGENKLFILMERGECDLDSIVKRLISNKDLTPAKLRFYWEEMLETIKALHEHNIVHADVKPSNFLLVEGRLKMIDFGLAVEMPKDKTWTVRNFVGGTKEYLSPETLSCFVIEEGFLKDPKPSGQQQAVIGFKSDIWALGIILYQWMYDGLAPYSHLPGGKLSKISALTNLEYPIEFEPLDDPLIIETLKLCLEKNPELRANLDQLLNHKFLTQR